jgi:hypothetical protein
VTRALQVALLLLALAAGRSSAAQDSTASPHGPLRLPCAQCHSPAGWSPARISDAFDHARLGFALVGAHVQATCRSCHTQLDFRGTSRECAACHADPHRGELGPNCARCHTSRSFIDRSLAASAHQLTAFPLTGAHRAADCESCHPTGQAGRMSFIGQPTDCFACHQANYQGARDPDHPAGGFPTHCVECHSTATWIGANFNHQATRFPLTGAHRAVACDGCHADRVYVGKNTACVSCHQPDYAATTDPSHVNAQLPSDCSQCHTTASWLGSTFNHSTTKFPLTGAHVPLDCNACHGDGVYAGKGTTCVTCHLTDYNTTTDPAHAPAQFPTDCSACHSTATWTGAQFNHDGPYFPIYSGAHAGKWPTCATCHTNPADYRVFDCLSCHQHNQTSTDGSHRGVSGYQYQSASCYSCHRQGRAG